jgi:hypothetical protein
VGPSLVASCLLALGCGGGDPKPAAAPSDVSAPGSGVAAPSAPDMPPAQGEATPASSATTASTAPATTDATSAPAPSTSAEAPTTAPPTTAPADARSTAKPDPKAAATTAGKKPAAPASASAPRAAGPDNTLKNLMKQMGGALTGGDAAAMVPLFEKTKALAPKDADFSGWGSIADKGRAAASGRDTDGAKAVCKQCHDAYRDKYKTKYGSKAQ